MKKKSLYEEPEVMVIVLQAEQSFLSGDEETKVQHSNIEDESETEGRW